MDKRDSTNTPIYKLRRRVLPILGAFCDQVIDARAFDSAQVVYNMLNPSAAAGLPANYHRIMDGSSIIPERPASAVSRAQVGHQPVEAAKLEIENPALAALQGKFPVDQNRLSERIVIGVEFARIGH